MVLALTIVSTAAPNQSEAEYWLLQQRLLPHADRCVRQIDDLERLHRLESVEASHALHNVGILYADQVKLVEAEKMYRRVLDGYINARGSDHPNTRLTAIYLALLREKVNT